ncbi:IclR family transcriptional regulator [Brucella thiophenivorans]|nr:IclR family transcriptional regulator [Brucella thiophenivorans]
MSENLSQGTQSLSRAFSILSAVAEGHCDLPSIGKATGMTRSTTHRLVAFLQRNSFMRYVDGRGYVLGSKLIEFGAKALAQMPLTEVARPILQKLSSETDDTIHLSVRDGDFIMYVDKVPGRRGLEMRSRIGARKPIAVTGTGKAQMLDLDETEWARLYSLAQNEILNEEVPPPGFLNWNNYLNSMREFSKLGYTIEIEENETGIGCVAAPIRDARGQIVAGLSVASTPPYILKSRLVNIASIVKSSAEEISIGLGYRS